MIEERLDEILGTKVAIKEDAKPTPGIWYYIWLKPKWHRIIVTASEYGDYGHPEFWKNYLAPKIMNHYGLEESNLSELEELAYSMPRGRVDSTDLMSGETTDRWMLFYGDDIPSSLDAESEKRQLVSAFNLTGPLLHGKVEFRVMGHEKMTDSHREAIQKLIGLIPY